MGSSTSGRYGRRPGAKRLTSECGQLTLAEGQYEGRLVVRREAQYRWNLPGQPALYLRVTIETDGVHLSYWVEDAGTSQTYEQTVYLIATPGTFGGQQSFLQCPTGCRARILYCLPDAAHPLWQCRRCSGLVYPSQRESTVQRKRRYAEQAAQWDAEQRAKEQRQEAQHQRELAARLQWIGR